MKSNLVIKEKKLRKRILSLFDDLDKSKRKRNLFIKNPTKILMKRVFKKDIPPQQQSESNRMLFSILANEKLTTWMDNYAEKNKTRKVTDNQFAQDFAEAVIEFGDKNILLALLKSKGETIRLPGMGEQFQQLIVNNPTNNAVAIPVCTPASCNQKYDGFGFGTVINPAVMRAVIEHLSSHAKKLSKQGKLADATTKIL